VVSVTETGCVHCAVRTVSLNIVQNKFCLQSVDIKYFECSAGSDSVKSSIITATSRPGSSVGVATDYGLDGPGIESR
jgi:hypothetical protein